MGMGMGVSIVSWEGGLVVFDEALSARLTLIPGGVCSTFTTSTCPKVDPQWRGVASLSSARLMSISASGSTTFRRHFGWTPRGESSPGPRPVHHPQTMSPFLVARLALASPTHSSRSNSHRHLASLLAFCRDASLVGIRRRATTQPHTFLRVDEAARGVGRRCVARRMGQAEPHVVLGVGRGASEAEVKRAFRRRAMETHPDVGGGSLEAYHRVREAYEACLSGAGRRERPARPGRGFGARYEGDWRGFGARQEEEGARAWRRAQARGDAERAWRQEQARAWAREARDRGPGPGARSGARSGGARGRVREVSAKRSGGVRNSPSKSERGRRVSRPRRPNWDNPIGARRNRPSRTSYANTGACTARCVRIEYV